MLSPRNPHRDIGLRVLDKLAGSPFDTLPKFDVSFKLNPSPAHIFRDLHQQATPRYRNQLLDFDDDNDRFLDLVTGWVAIAHDIGTDVTQKYQTLYSASDIPATQGGLGASKVQFPAFFNEADVMLRNDDSGKPRLVTTLSPAGSITDPHIDGTGSGLCLFEVFGLKLLFTWPASAPNLKWMEDRHGIKRGPLKLSQAIDEMSGMSVTPLEGHKGVLLDPGMIHAVMSVENSAISGWDFVKSAWLRSDDVRRQMLWEGDLAKKQENGLLDHDSYNIRRYLEEDLKLWQSLGEKLDDEKAAESVRTLISSVRAVM